MNHKLSQRPSSFYHYAMMPIRDFMKKNQVFRLYILFLPLLLAIDQVAAQSAILDQYIEQAKQENLSIKDAKLQRVKQLVRVEQAKKLWGPSVDFSGSYLLARGGRLINFPVGDLFNPVYQTLNQVTQTNDFPTDLENQDIQLTPNNFLDLQVQATMPILNSSIRYNQKIQQKLVELEEVQVQLNEQEVVLQVKTAYLNYLKSYAGLDILDTSKAFLEDVLAFNKKLVRFDKATDEIIFDVEFQIEELNSQRAGLSEQQVLAQALFNLVLNRSLDAEIEVDTTLVKSIEIDVRTIEELQNLAQKKRMEFQQVTVGEQANELNKELIKKEAQPTAGVFGGIGFQTENFDFDIGGPLFTLGLAMDWNIYDNGRRKKRIEELEVEQKILDNSRAQINQQVNIEIIQAYYGMQSLQSRMRAEESAERSATQSLKRFETRYKNGKALLIELLQAQNRLTTSRLNQVLTQYDYLIKKAELENALGE